MADMTRPLIGIRQALADIVNQSSVQHDTVVAQLPGLLKTQQNVQAGIDLGMIFFRLRDAEQIIDLG